MYRLFLVRFWPSREQHDTLSKKCTVIFEYKDATLITRLLTGQADIPIITTAQIKIPSDIKYHKLNMITHRNSTEGCNNRECVTNHKSPKCNNVQNLYL